MEQRYDLSLFQKKVLRCITDNNKTAKEIHAEYVRMHPHGKVSRFILPAVSFGTVNEALHVLIKIGLIRKEVTRFLDGPVSDTIVYSLSDAGRAVLRSKSFK